jgi:hypothetical protein
MQTKKSLFANSKKAFEKAAQTTKNFPVPRNSKEKKFFAFFLLNKKFLLREFSVFVEAGGGWHRGAGKFKNVKTKKWS